MAASVRLLKIGIFAIRLKAEQLLDLGFGLKRHAIDLVSLGVLDDDLGAGDLVVDSLRVREVRAQSINYREEVVPLVRCEPERQATYPLLHLEGWKYVAAGRAPELEQTDRRLDQRAVLSVLGFQRRVEVVRIGDLPAARAVRDLQLAEPVRGGRHQVKLDVVQL